MKQTYHYIICAFCAILGLSSCSDFLEIEPKDKVILEKFWNEKTDVDNVVAGCYSGLQTYGVVSRMMAWGEFRSENVNTTGLALKEDLSLHRLLSENIDASNGYTAWNEFYNVINRCNTVLLYAPRVAERDPSYTESEMRATEAEVIALRSLCYFYLIRTFRDVPYSTVAFTDDDQKMDLPATPFYDVLDSLINDLERVQSFAVRKYPATNSANRLYQTGRITQDAIHAMLCEMYLWKKDYQNCVKYADLVIKSKQEAARNDEGLLLQDMQQRFNGFPLIREWGFSNSASLFGNAYEEIFGTGNSSEGIFELTFMQNDNMLCNGPVNTLYAHPESMPGFVKPSDYIGLDQLNSAYKVFTNKYDARAYESLYPLSKTATFISKYVLRNATIDAPANATTVERDALDLTSIYAKDKNHSNWIVYRLTDIMLLKAEALVQQMTDAGTEQDASLQVQAFTLVNAVNKRSICKSTLTDKDTLQLADYGTKALMEELVMKERHRELLYEGKRWYDLVRRSLRDGNTLYLRTQVSQKGLENGSIVNSKLARIDAIFWPYNLEELKVNKNLVQNPAFGSGEDSSIEKTAN